MKGICTQIFPARVWSFLGASALSLALSVAVHTVLRSPLLHVAAMSYHQLLTPVNRAFPFWVSHWLLSTLSQLTKPH